MHLAIDTSTNTASITVATDYAILAELTWCCGQNHSVELMPRLKQLLEQGRINFESVTAIVVAIGPGSFNGLRVGVSTAKALAFSLRVPIVGISTLETIAYPLAETGIPVCAIINAGRSEVASALFQQKNGRWGNITPAHITTIDTLCRDTDTSTVFCGEITQAAIDELTEKLGSKAIVPSASSRLRRSGFLAELGFKRLQSGSYDNPASLQPVYLRKPPITPHKNMAPLCADEL